MEESGIDTPTSVYQYFDGRGILLYAGMTDRGPRRGHEHADTKVWWKYVTYQTVAHYPTRTLARAEEKRLIRAYAPPFNTQDNPRWREARAAYEEQRTNADAVAVDQTPAQERLLEVLKAIPEPVVTRRPAQKGGRMYRHSDDLHLDGRALVAIAMRWDVPLRVCDDVQDHLGPTYAEAFSPGCADADLARCADHPMFDWMKMEPVGMATFCASAEGLIFTAPLAKTKRVDEILALAEAGLVHGEVGFTFVNTISRRFSGSGPGDVKY